MTLFLLDTDAALNAADAFKDVTKKFYNLSYTVDDYDITSSDFNFKAVKSLIANNIQACAVKASNTACYINKVVTGHTELQKKEKYEEEKPDIPDFEKPSTPVTLPPTSAPTNVPTTPIPSGPTTIYTTSPPINLYYPARVVAASCGGVASVVAVTYTPEPTTPPEEKVEEKEVEGSKKVDVKVDNISHEEVDKENLNSAGRFMFEHDDFGYDESGYAKVGDRYVISCTEEYGVVGDEINIKLKDGSIVKCIIGQLNDGESSRLNFFVK